VAERNHHVQEFARCLQIALLYEQLRNAALSDDEEQAVKEWAVRVRDFAIELFSLQRATELIQDKYFDRECILLEDAKICRRRFRSCRNGRKRMTASSSCKADLATNSEKLQPLINERASKTSSLVTALARSKSLDDFGEPEAADVILRAYIPAAND
jgi:hypothetical protein